MAKLRLLLAGALVAVGCAGGGGASIVEVVDFDTSTNAEYQVSDEGSMIVLEVGLGFEVGSLSVDFFPSDFECGTGLASDEVTVLPLDDSFSTAQSSGFRTIWRVSTTQAAGVVECLHGLGADVGLRLQVWIL